ncbi:hypothetical protein KZR06_12080 [Lacticaseibacillus paracasei]|uniref:hypothetical protein n=1 Tax=Lacticaseibacillus paracasei TaxID=1597 RepID=UPI0021A27FAD|nr:hypothetical protein [Lacticaseibacillus paracasei]UWP76171.1 hypothetical protein KZR06_12080 [Lacticaseibacillus paracasei]
MKGIVVETNEMLFDQLMSLRDAKTPEQIAQEVERAKAMSTVATNITNNIAVSVKAAEVLGGTNQDAEQTLADAVGEATYTGEGIEGGVQAKIRLEDKRNGSVDGIAGSGN